MPNWCAVSIKIEGKSDNMKKFYMSLNTFNENGKKVSFSFFQLVPRPEAEKNNWYDWNTKNWGTKWDACEVVIFKETAEYIIIQCNTAWSPPTKWAINASKLYPDLTFTVAYCESGMEFYGVDIINDIKRKHS